MSSAGSGHIAAIGAALSANKGAASMLQALVDNVDDVVPGGRILCLSIYPRADRVHNRSQRLEIVSLTPIQMVFSVLPLAFMIALARLLGGSGRSFARTPSLRALMDAHVVADLAGISFVDRRGFPTLVYNVLTTGIPVLVGAPVVKCSQALGPFNKLSTRLAGLLVLPRVTRIVARGRETYRYLSRLGLGQVVQGADLAFLLSVGDEPRQEAARVLESLHGEKCVVVCPSSVVEALCEDRGIDYVLLMSETIQRIAQQTGLPVVLLPHSAQPGKAVGRMNDIPVCEAIHSRVADRFRVLLISESLGPATLRAIIGSSTVLVTSRFHAMISGLAMGVPTVVVGWSHKYAEVMAEFGLEDFVVPYSEFNTQAVTDLVSRLIENRRELVDQIDSALPRVSESSRASLTALREAIRG